MPICPTCESRDVRRSHSHRSFDFTYRWRGLQIYRCNECLRRFSAPPPADPSVKRSRRSEARKMMRLGLDIFLFVVLVAVFYAVIQFVRE